MKLTKKIKDFLRPDIRISQFCIKADMSRSTFVRRLKNPENFTVKEIQVLKEMSGLTEKEIFQTEKENSQN
ncbi:hypothetical protein [Bergeyella zoohelcum]